MKPTLTTRPKADDEKSWPAYDSVKKWTKAVDVFQQDLIIVPVNENLHWYLAVIFNPRALIQAPATEPRQTADARSASASDPSRGTSATAESSKKDKDPLDVMSEDEEDGSVENLKEQVKDCHISPKAASPKPIRSMELEWIAGQDKKPSPSPPPKTPSPVTSKTKYKRDAIDVLDSRK